MALSCVVTEPCTPIFYTNSAEKEELEMGRRREKEVFVSLTREQAIELATRVFGLQDKLGISTEQMAKESGLTKSSLSCLRHNWASGKSKRTLARMNPTSANALKAFYNKHLFNDKVKPAKAKKAATPKRIKAKPEETNSDKALRLLVAKVGLDKARELLAARGKEDRLAGYLEALEPEALADMVE